MKRFRFTWTVLAMVVCLGLVLPSATLAKKAAGPQEASKPAKDQKPAEGKPEDKKPPEAPKGPEDKAFADVVKDYEVRQGLFTFYYKADENKLLLEILPGQFDKIYQFSGTTERAVGERGLYSSQQGGDFAFVFRRVGKNVQWVKKNSSFMAEPGTPQARATGSSFPDSILATVKTLSKPHPERNSVLVDVADLFLSDLPGIAPVLNIVYQPTNYRFDKASSWLGPAKAFPENVIVDVWLHYVTDNPRSPSITVPDERSVPILVKYDLSSLPDTGYKPRLADDRVGQFLTVRQDFSSDHPTSPYKRYINRWQLEKKDPGAALSEPKEPIVFYLENTIPVEYREYFREGALLWNKAFEKIGFKNAIVVKQQPDDATWEAADTRYHTIRWFAGVDATFAIGPSRVNPFTGQIYDADIGFAEGLVRFARRDAEEFVGPVVPVTSFDEQPLPAIWGRNALERCSYGDGLVQQATLSMAVLDARGELSPELIQQIMHEYIVEVTAHEVGHTLGLRHNFRASTLLSVADLNNVQKTEEIGQTASVMDYNPVVVAPKGTKQGHFLTPTLGPYDYWAIEYAYKPIEGDEKAELAKIASRVADPTVPYSTDEDALGTYSPLAIDPLVNQFDQSSDPLAYFKQDVATIHELWASMESKLAKPGEGYQILRRSLARSIGEYNRAVLTSSKYIGGIYHVRDHVDDPHGRPPYTVVPAAKQHEALEFLRSAAFSEKSFELPPGLINKLAIDRQEGLDFISYFLIQRLDLPWHDAVLNLQRNVLNRLFHPVLLNRVLDNELRFAPGEKTFTMADLFRGLDTAIWSELDTNPAKISSLRRNLQREHLKQLTRVLLRPMPPQGGPGPVGVVIPVPPTPRVPEDATTLARASLIGIQAKIKAALAAGKVTDPTTKAHLEETQARIAAALQAHVDKPAE
ncbi:MAG TPA: zinc-dependent metalloprotease [Methylomirabilota bacterium]|nr:zinc-dependent metalloprotease [Methylomirabilota bacterium]